MKCGLSVGSSNPKTYVIHPVIQMEEARQVRRGRPRWCVCARADGGGVCVHAPAGAWRRPETAEPHYLPAVTERLL